MRIAVIGPGATGSLFAAYLTEGGLEVHLIDHRPERAAAIAASGIQIFGVRGEHRVAVRTSSDAQAVGAVDLVILAVKAAATGPAMDQHGALVGPGTAVWSVQNGLGNLETIAARFGPAKVLGGTTTTGANLVEAGRVHHAGEGDTFMGELDGRLTERVRRLAGALTAAGLKVEPRADIQALLWQKVLINAGINPLTAILGVRNGALVESQAALQVMERAVAEGLRAAAAAGIDLDPAAVQERVREVARRTAKNRSSMLQDIQAGRRTEVDFINGEIARRAQAPVNWTLARLVRAIERTQGERPWTQEK